MKPILPASRHEVKRIAGSCEFARPICNRPASQNATPQERFLFILSHPSARQRNSHGPLAHSGARSQRQIEPKIL
jgi:hypothetical protein